MCRLSLRPCRRQRLREWSAAAVPWRIRQGSGHLRPALAWGTLWVWAQVWYLVSRAAASQKASSESFLLVSQCACPHCRLFTVHCALCFLY